MKTAQKLDAALKDLQQIYTGEIEATPATLEIIIERVNSAKNDLEINKATPGKSSTN